MLHYRVPTLKDLCALIYQGLQQDLFNAYFDLFQDIDDAFCLNEEEVDWILRHGAPRYIYIVTANDSGFNDEWQIFDYPQLYTSVHRYSSFEGGLYAMERFGKQSYDLLNCVGTELLDYSCHDLNIGVAGILEYRPNRTDIGWFYTGRIKNGLFHLDFESEHGMGGFPYSPDVHIGMYAGKEQEYDALYPKIDCSNKAQAKKHLISTCNSWRVLQQFYCNDKVLARLAIEQNCKAFIYLSDDLQNDTEFVKILVNDKELSRVYAYLPEDLKNNIDIAYRFAANDRYNYYNLTKQMKDHPKIVKLRRQQQMNRPPLGASLAAILNSSATETEQNPNDDLPF
jgi:hypothetical protein